MRFTSCNDLRGICASLSTYQSALLPVSGQRQAAVALVLRPGQSDPEVLFIQRAPSPQDPWSGQIALPGGGLEVDDESVLMAAVRETREEVDLALRPDQLVVRLDDTQGRNNNRRLNLVISCFVFEIAAGQGNSLHPNYEVAEAFWVPLSRLTNQINHFEYQTDYQEQPFPAINLGNGAQGQPRVLWGLTYRFILRFLDASGIAVKSIS